MQPESHHATPRHFLEEAEASDEHCAGQTFILSQYFVHELHHLLRCIATDDSVAPHGATFEDGYRASEVCDAILRSAAAGRREEVRYTPIAGSR